MYDLRIIITTGMTIFIKAKLKKSDETGMINIDKYIEWLKILQISYYI